MPLMRGFPRGPAWHAAKILECGAAAVVNRKTPDCMFAWLRRDHFVVEAPDQTLRCTPQSIASHSLYENADPFQLVECSGTLDLTEVRYEAVSERAVKVTGSTFIAAERYTVKLEGAEKVGLPEHPHRLGARSVHHPPDRRLDRAADRRASHARVKMVYGDRLQARRVPAQHPRLRQERHDGAARAGEGNPRARAVPACSKRPRRRRRSPTSIAGIMRHQALHLPIPEWSGLITAIACPYNATRARRGVPLQRQSRRRCPTIPYEMFPMELVDVDGGGTHEEMRMTQLGIARAPHPQQERRAVRADLRHHVRGRGDATTACKRSGALTRERVARASTACRPRT